MSHTPDDILILLKTDEAKAFRWLFERYRDILMAYVFRIVNHAGVAEDIVQDFFVYLWTTGRLRSFEGDLDHFIFQAVKNRAFLYLKEDKKRQTADEAFAREQDLKTDASAEDDSRGIEELYRTINRLPEKCRQIFLMAVLDEKSYQAYAVKAVPCTYLLDEHNRVVAKNLRGKGVAEEDRGDNPSIIRRGFQSPQGQGS